MSAGRSARRSTCFAGATITSSMRLVRIAAAALGAAAGFVSIAARATPRAVDEVAAVRTARGGRTLSGCLDNSSSKGSPAPAIRHLTRQSAPSEAVWFAAAQSDNVNFHFTPAAVAYPASAGQVGQAVRCASEAGVPVVARSGGHSFAGYSSGGQDGALVVDLAALDGKQFFPDAPQGKVAEFGPAARLGDVVRFLWTAGQRGMSHGTCPAVAIGGHAMCNGFGPTSAAWGLMSDNLVDVDVVLANGSLVRATPEHNPDLLWAVRGAGQFFGIATRLRFRTYDASSPMGYIRYRWNALKEPETLSAIVQTLQTWAADPSFPNELGFHIQVAPAAKGLTVEVRGMWLRPLAEYTPWGEKLRALMKQLHAPLPPIVNETEVNYFQLAALWDDFGDATHKLNPAALNGTRDNFIPKSTLASDRSKPLAPGALDQLSSYLFTLPRKEDGRDWGWNVYMEMYGLPHAKYRRPEAAGAAAGPTRDGSWLIQATVLTPQNKVLPAPARKLVVEMEQHVREAVTSSGSTPTGFACYVDADKVQGQQWMSEYYGYSGAGPDGGSTWSRLLRLKHQLDPHNLFRSPQTLGTAPGVKPADNDLDYTVHPLP